MSTLTGSLTRTDIGRGRVITDEVLPLKELRSITVYQDNREVGRLFMVQPEEIPQAVLVDVTVFWPEDRRKGYASDMLAYVKEKFPAVITSYRSKPGLKLCLKNGFKLTRPPFGGKKAFLTYSMKEAGDGREEHAGGGCQEEDPLPAGEGESQGVK